MRKTLELGPRLDRDRPARDRLDAQGHRHPDARGIPTQLGDVRLRGANGAGELRLRLARPVKVLGECFHATENA